MAHQKTMKNSKQLKGELYIEYMPLNSLQPASQNPKDHDLGAIHGSMDRFGYTAPMMLDEATGQLVAGHGRLETLQQKKASGEPAPPRVLEQDGDWFVPVVRGLTFENEREAEAYLIADNRLVELGGWDDAALAKLLEEIVTETGTLAGTGYGAEDLDQVWMIL